MATKKGSEQLAEGAEGLHVLALGDWGGHHKPPYITDQQSRVAALMSLVAAQKPLDFIVSLGDNFYMGGVTSGADARFQQTFEQVYPRETLGVTWYIIAGNHDYEGNVDAQIEYSRSSDRWHFPALYYTSSHTVPGTALKLKLIHIDTVVLCGLHQSDPADIEAADRHWTWIEHQLAEAQSDAYVVVIGHYPIVSAGYHGDTKILVDRLDPLLRAHRVNAYLSGHDHCLQHFTSIGSPWTVHYCVSGTGATKSFETFATRHPSLYSTHYHSNLPGFLDISVTGARLTIRTIGDEGELLHTVKSSPRRHRRTSNGET